MRQLVFLALAGLAAGCGGASIQLQRDFGEESLEESGVQSISPEAFVDRYGEPDEWRHEGEGANLRMIATWRCLDGKLREVTWRQRSGPGGQQYWDVVNDVTAEGECD
jgi:hypothetical protein